MPSQSGIELFRFVVFLEVFLRNIPRGQGLHRICLYAVWGKVLASLFILVARSLSICRRYATPRNICVTIGLGYEAISTWYLFFIFSALKPRIYAFFLSHFAFLILGVDLFGQLLPSIFFGSMIFAFVFANKWLLILGIEPFWFMFYFWKLFPKYTSRSGVTPQSRDFLRLRWQVYISWKLLVTSIWPHPLLTCHC